MCRFFYVWEESANPRLTMREVGLQPTSRRLLSHSSSLSYSLISTWITKFVTVGHPLLLYNSECAVWRCQAHFNCKYLCGPYPPPNLFHLPQLPSRKQAFPVVALSRTGVSQCQWAFPSENAHLRACAGGSSHIPRSSTVSHDSTLSISHDNTQTK